MEKEFIEKRAKRRKTKPSISNNEQKQVNDERVRKRRKRNSDAEKDNLKSNKRSASVNSSSKNTKKRRVEVSEKLENTKTESDHKNDNLDVSDVTETKPLDNESNEAQTKSVDSSNNDSSSEEKRVAKRMRRKVTHQKNSPIKRPVRKRPLNSKQKKNTSKKSKNKKNSKLKSKIIDWTFTIIAILLIVYFWFGFINYGDKFIPGTYIDGVDCSNCTIKQAEQKLNESPNIKSEVTTDKIVVYLKKQNKLKWALGYFTDTYNYSINNS